MDNHPADSRVAIRKDNKVQTLSARMGTGGNNIPMLMRIRCGKEGGGKGALIQKDKSGTLACHNDQTLYEPYSTSKGSYHTRANEGKASTLMATDYKDPPTICGEQTDKRIRRLTPLECCRLQGFPDNWCDGIKHSDSAEYKMWGNGMSLPCAKYVMEGIVEDMRGKKNDT